jgi:hypothetical protein
MNGKADVRFPPIADISIAAAVSYCSPVQMNFHTLRSMNLAARLGLSFLVPPAFMAAYVCAVYKFGLHPFDATPWLVMVVPTIGGAALLAHAPWPLVPKGAVVASYLAAMFGLLVFVGLAVSCAFGDCI